MLSTLDNIPRMQSFINDQTHLFPTFMLENTNSIYFQTKNKVIFRILECECLYPLYKHKRTRTHTHTHQLIQNIQ